MKIIALDLEGTLILNGMSQIPRPHLNIFLSCLKEYSSKIVIYTTLSERKFNEIANVLVKEKVVPDWFKDLEYINWQGEKKDLRYIDDNIDNILIVDDYEEYIMEEQKSQWIKINQFEYPYGKEDKELLKIIEIIKKANI